MKSKKKIDEKDEIYSKNFGQVDKPESNKGRIKHSGSISNNLDLGKKIEEHGITESEAKANEVYQFNMDGRVYKFKITPNKGIEYVLKSAVDREKWTLIEFSNILEFECVSETHLPAYKIMFLLKLKNKVNDKEAHKFTGENESDYNNFSKRLDAYFVKDK